MSIRLRTGLIVTFTALVILLSAVLSLLISRYSTAKVEEEIGQSVALMAYQMSDKLGNFMWSRAGEIDIVGGLDVFQDPAQIGSVQKLLNQLKASFPSFSWVGFVSPDGTVLAATDSILLGNNIKARPVYQEGLKGRFFGDVHDAILLAQRLPNPTGEPLQFVDISIPVNGADGTLRGVLAAHMSWEWAREVERSVLAPLQAHEKNVEIIIVSRTENTVLLGPKAMVGTPLNISSVKRAQAGENGWELVTWPDGNEYVTGFALDSGYLNYPGLGWTVLVREPKASALLAVRELRTYILAVGLFAVMLFAVMGWLMAELISKPLRSLTEAADRLRTGEAVTIPELGGFSDIAALSRSLKNLVESLSRTETALGTMQQLAHYDQLTGLPNRTALERYLEQAIEQVDQNGGTLSFLYMDLDGFKQVNDSLGHQFGDLLLKKVAGRLLAVIPGGDIVVRLGGDEFLAVLHTPSEQPVVEAKRVAEGIISELSRTFVIEYQKVNIGCSIGGSVYRRSGASPSEVIRVADEALYSSKRAGNNHVTFIGVE